MKKLLFSGIACTVVLTIATALATHANRPSETNLLEVNIEALSQSESGTVKCCPDPGDQCKLSNGDILVDQDEC